MGVMISWIKQAFKVFLGGKTYDDWPPSEVWQQAASDINNFVIHDCPINLLRLDDLRLYNRSQLTEALAKDIIRTLGYKNASEYNKEDVIKAFSVASRYAVFSHRWGANELTYRTSFQKVLASKGNGAVKIKNFCERAHQYGCRYVWFDTGCINSSNSSELDESIRSMYDWYQKAYVCIVHLGQTSDPLSNDGGADEWFQRGWTLQELLAPQRLKFYKSDWDAISTDEYDIHRGALTPASRATIRAISGITGIDEASLRSFQPNDMNVRRVLTWASKRRTSRPEDIVYCLFGLLDVSLNVAYGEGQERAFTRLQIELLKRYDDRSLFLFDGEFASRNQMLARSPSAFSAPFSGIILPSDTLLFREGRTTPDINMTIYGLHMAAVLYPVSQDHPTSSYVSIEDLGQHECSLKDPSRIDDERSQMFFAILGHAQSKGRRLFFGVLVRRPGVGAPSRYTRLPTIPPILRMDAIDITMNKEKDELISLKEPVMIYIE